MTRHPTAGRGTLVLLLSLALGVAALRRRIAVVSVLGPSMRPTLSAGDRVLVRRATISDLRRGHVVVVERPGLDGAWLTQPPHWPPDGRKWLIKRVAALPGDIRPDVPMSVAGSAGQVVPAGSLFVLGDNAASSMDSRYLGYIPANRLLGVMVRPLARQA